MNLSHTALRSVALERVRVQIFFCSIYVAVAYRCYIHTDITLTLYIVYCSIIYYCHCFSVSIFRLYTARDRRRVNAVCVWSCSVRLYLPQSAEPQRDVHVAQLPRLLPAKHRVSLSVLRHGQRTSAHRVSTLWRRGHDKVGSREPIETGESPSTGRPAGVSIASIINVRQSASGALTNVV